MRSPFLYWFSQIFYFSSTNCDIFKIFLGIYPLHNFSGSLRLRSPLRPFLQQKLWALPLPASAAKAAPLLRLSPDPRGPAGSTDAPPALLAAFPPPAPACRAGQCPTARVSVPPQAAPR